LSPSWMVRGHVGIALPSNQMPWPLGGGVLPKSSSVALHVP
jgi:hypothetical protein